MTSIGSNNTITVINQTLHDQIRKEITKDMHNIQIAENVTLPIDAVRVIASFIDLKPKYLVKCCQLSKGIKNIIMAENEDNKEYWNNHIIIRWGNWLSNNYFDTSSYVVDRIKEYSKMYLTEKRAHKYYITLTETRDVFDTEWYIEQKYYPKANIFLHVAPFILGQSPKTDFLYLAGYYGSFITSTDYTFAWEKLSWDTKTHWTSADGDIFDFRNKLCHSWLKQAAEKGHMEAARVLGLRLIYQGSEKDDFDKILVLEGIKWLRIAAAKKNQKAIDWLEKVHDYKHWDSDDDTECNTVCTLSDEVLDKISQLARKSCKRPLENAETDQPPAKKQKLEEKD